MTDNAPITWSVLIPVKLLAQAKSRLAAFAGPRRGELALAIAGDTVAAVLDCDQAARTIVITDDPVARSALAGLGALVVPDEPDDGLNAALRHGAAHAAARWPGSGTAALSADLARAAPRPARAGAAGGRGLAVGLRRRRRGRRHDAVRRGSRGAVRARVRPGVPRPARGGRGRRA